MVRFRVMALLCAVLCSTLLSHAVAAAGSPWALAKGATVVPTGETPAWAVEMTSAPDPTTYYGVTGGVVIYTPPSSLTFGDIYQLSTDWRAVTPWGGGTPRLALAMDYDNDGDFQHWAEYPGSLDFWLFVYITDNPTSTALYGPAGGWQNTGNLIGNENVNLYDSGQFPLDLNGDGQRDGRYSGYSYVRNLFASTRVMEMLLVTDGGWFLPRLGYPAQIVWANNLTCNRDVLSVSGPSIQAATDTYAVARNTPLNIFAPGVLGNDTDPFGAGLFATLYAGCDQYPGNGGPFHGSVALLPDGSFSYTPAAGFVGQDMFLYHAQGTGVSAQGQVFLNVFNPNSAPVATPQSATTAQNRVKTLTLAGTDANGDVLTYAVKTQPAHGLLSGTGSALKYTPNLDYVGADSFTFTVSDGEFTSAPATVSLTVTAATVKRNLTLHYTGGTVEYGTDGVAWAPFTLPTMALAPAAYQVRFRGQYVVSITVPSTGAAEYTAMLATLATSTGAPLTGGVITQLTGGVTKSLGTTGATGGKLVLYTGLALPQTISMGYAYGTVTKTQDIVADSVVAFTTKAVTVQLTNDAGTLFGTATAKYFGGGAWRSMGAMTSGTVTKELLPGTSTFQLTYAGATVEKAQDVSADATVVFQTGKVVSATNTATKYLAGGVWRTFTQSMQLLPGTYTFQFKTGVAQETFTITAGTVNTIR